MAITVGNGNYGAYAGYTQNTKKISGQDRRNVSSARQTSAKDNNVKLSERAQALLEKLRKIYKDMDFMVADYESGEDAKEILSRGTKEYSVLFSSEELEKMASSEKYEKEYISRMEGAVRMSEQINKENGFTSALGKNVGEGVINRIGIAFNKDGSTSFFAELEKTTAKQRERIEAGREARAQEKKENTSTKKVTLWASSVDELLKSIREVDWSEVKEEKQGSEGTKFNLTV